MLKNNLLIALRSLQKNRLYTAINLFGLAFGMLCFTLLGLYVIDEWTFDRFHKNASHIYRVVEQKTLPQKGSEHLAAVAFKVSSAAISAFPEIERSSILTQMGRMSYQNKANARAFYEPFLSADSAFFQLFNFNMLQGNPATALNQPNSVVLTQEFANRLFGDQDALGKTIDTDRGIAFQVTGILEDLPVNSHLQFPAVISFCSFKNAPWYDRMVTSDWSSNFFTTYFKIKAGTNTQELAEKITALVKTNYPEEQQFQSRFALQALPDIHFNSADFQNDLQTNAGSRQQSLVLAFIGLFILLIACINYMNLSTARTETYGREVGIRKVVGASRSNLFGRFFLENILLTTGALVLAIGMTWVLLPAFNEFTGKNLSIDVVEHLWLLPFFLALVGIVGLFAGSYPAVFLSRFAPANALKGLVGISQKQQLNAGQLRRGLVVFQFMLGIIMIVATLVTYRQMEFVRSKNLGFNQDHLVVADINSGAVRRGFAQIKAGYAQLPEVHSVTVSNRVPGEWKIIPQVRVQQLEAKDESAEMYYFSGDADFLRTFEVKLLHGRNFDPERLADTAALLINQRAADLLGISQANGQQVQIPQVLFDGSAENLPVPFEGQVIGIIQDFHFQSLHETIQPVVVGYFSNPIHSIDYFTARISGNDITGTLAAMEQIIQKTDPSHLFEYHFLDDQIAQFYSRDIRQSRIFSLAALCAVLIACMGLFGQAVLATQRRTKEIGIRKVLGASVAGLVGALSRDFLRLVLLALAIATPVAWILMDRWLENFAYRISIGWWSFVFAGLLALGVAFLTVSIQCLKAARANPVRSLRNE
ncbi:MAG: ABC transporter permease [Saprospiraceae bacterium]|nr:ABC transporter permease [Saprospiraceae bacterium]